MNASFSIITINLNNQVGLAKTQQSVMAQTCQDYEWIVVDGGSRDGSIELIKACTRVNQAIIEPDRGIFDAINKGIVRSQGEWIITLNSGDCFASTDVLERVKKIIKDKDIYFGNAVYTLDNKILDWRWPFYANLDFDLWLRDYHPWHQATFVHRRICNKVLYDPLCQMSGDNKFFAEIKNNAIFEYMPLDVCHFELEGVGSSSLSLKANLKKAMENSAISGGFNIAWAVLTFVARKLLGRDQFYRWMRWNQARRMKKYILE